MLGRLQALLGLRRVAVDPSHYRAAMSTTSGQPQIATFASGCFWGTEHIFLNVGYTGGKESSANPDYRTVCSGSTDHAEALKIEFDESKVSYADLVEFFYRSHDPTTVNRQGGDTGTLTEEVQTKQFTHKGKKIVTEITEAGPWWNAEEYHQLYLEKNPTAINAPHIGFTGR
ncbi:peptide methionine sulfoxide reductase MsrA [Mucidula mucida]|nr:peptide methionine sulfoxide reductase MsrA [Mucidula mucida]